jgi:hypothetical protein
MHVTSGPQKTITLYHKYCTKLTVLMAVQHTFNFSSKANSKHSSHAEEAKQTASNSISSEEAARRV